MVPLVAFSLLCASATAAVGLQSSEAGKASERIVDWADDEGRRFHDLNLFGAITHRSLDDDCDGILALEDLATAFGVSADDPQTERRLKAYDPDEDGNVTPAELTEGIRSGVREQVDVTMLVDANDDGELTLKEHALGFPDPEGERDASGFTPRQIQSFRFFDQDGDERITRREVTQRHEMTFLVIAWARTIAHHVQRIDEDGDGLVRVEELVKGLGYGSTTELSPEQEAWYDTLSTDHGGDPAIELGVFRIQLLQDRPVKSRMAMERPIRPLLVPACAWGKK